jgi:hypothetical protein
MADQPNEPPDIQAIVDAAVKEAVAQSMASIAAPLSRQEKKNLERAKEREKRDEDRQDRRDERKAKRNASREPKIEDEKNPIAEKGEEDRKAQNRNLGQQEPRVVPADSDKPETERKVTIAESLGPIRTPQPSVGFDPREFLRDAVSRASSVNHPWKVYRAGETVQEGSPELLAKYGLIGGIVYSQWDPVTVPDNPEIVGANGSGFVYLEITRDVDSREITAVSAKCAGTVPTSDYATQYRPLAYVFGVGGAAPLQLQFEEMRVWELMLVENGELKLLDFNISSRSSYDLPA